MIDTRTLKVGDLVIVDERSWDVQMVLTHGPKTFDLIERCGGTTRRRHGVCVRLATLADFNSDPAYEARAREALEVEASAARTERRAGLRRKRGLVSPRR